MRAAFLHLLAIHDRNFSQDCSCLHLVVSIQNGDQTIRGGGDEPFSFWFVVVVRLPPTLCLLPHCVLQFDFMCQLSVRKQLKLIRRSVEYKEKTLRVLYVNCYCNETWPH
jgi:hypothetical protein